MANLPAHNYLEQLGIPFERGNFPVETEKGAANVAACFSMRARQMVKTLIFEIDSGERILVMVGGDQNVVSGHLKKVAGSRNIQLASPDAVKQTTGYVIGSIPPFSWQPDGFRSFLDLFLMDEGILGVGAGVWGNEIFITPVNLVKASRARVVNLTDRVRPVFIE
jgi:Cys-tRNA(Pro)/Cys-tRNA(Cys) deacylase